MNFYNLALNITHDTIIDLCDQNFEQITIGNAPHVIAVAKDIGVIFCDIQDITVNSNCLLVRIIVE